MKQTLRYNLVDVFTDTPLTGNPLAVFTRGHGLAGERMQAIAREMNLSETVFFLPAKQGGHARLRIFTPYQELPFAGHPVLGSAWILAGPMEMNQLRIETGAGIIPIDLDRQGDRLHSARMTQPLPEFRPYENEPELLSALGLSPSRSGLLSARHAKNGPEHLLVETPSAEVLNALSPSYHSLAKVTKAGVLAFAQEGPVCQARYFAPAAGINEDPATGSAAGPLGALLVLEGRHRSDEELVVYQGQAMGRPSTLVVTATLEEKKLSRVTVAGQAVIIARGELLL
jgi:trans-2,3-dihydro-3-hydroxyanthranilate isomerase